MGFVLNPRGSFLRRSPWSSTSGCRRTGVRWRCSSVGTVSAASTQRGEGEEGRKREKKVVFSYLQANDFQHPLDVQATKLFGNTFGLNAIVKSMMTPNIEKLLSLDNMASGILVGPNQLPHIYEDLVEACEVLGIQNVPDLFIQQNSMPNAYTLAIQSRKPFIVIHTSLIELLTKSELQAVLAHELGHLKCDHGVLLTAGSILLQVSDLILGTSSVLVLAPLRDSILRWLRSAELSCDRAALLVAQDPKVVISMMMKIVGGSSKITNDLNVDEYMQQAREYQKAVESSPGFGNRAAGMTHPLTVQRAMAIESWALSPQYRKLLRRAKNSSRK